MDLKKKIGQLMVFGFNGPKMTPEIKKMIHEYHLGGIILFGRNIGDPNEVLALTSELQNEAKKAGHKHPLFICTDQENGAVRRLGEGSTVFPGAMLLGATHNPDYAFKIGEATGKELKAVGINWNLSPILDVNNNPENPVIGVRSFGESAENVSNLGKQLMGGMQAGGVLTTLKHFPGHGDTNIDSHLDLPTISHAMDRLEEIELRPFKESIKAGADVVMTAHVYFPAIESESGVPATLSKRVITGLLREQLHFNGVVTTDCMEMNAISKTIGTPQGAIKAIQAGVDLIMISHTYEPQQQTLDAIFQAVEHGELSEQLIDQALGRVLQLKEKYISWNDVSFHPKNSVPSIVGSRDHHKLAEDVYREGVTIVRNTNHTLPIRENQRVLVVYPENHTTMAVEDKRYSTFSLGESIKELHPSADVVQLSNPPTDQEMSSIVERADDYDVVIVATLSAVTLGGNQVKLVHQLYESGHEIVVVATRSPYDLIQFPQIPTYVCTYEFTTPALKMAAKAIFGKEEVRGRLPVTIPLPLG